MYDRSQRNGPLNYCKSISEDYLRRVYCFVVILWTYASLGFTLAFPLGYTFHDPIQYVIQGIQSNIQILNSYAKCCCAIITAQGTPLNLLSTSSLKVLRSLSS